MSVSEGDSVEISDGAATERSPQINDAFDLQLDAIINNGNNIDSQSVSNEAANTSNIIYDCAIDPNPTAETPETEECEEENTKELVVLHPDHVSYCLSFLFYITYSR